MAPYGLNIFKNPPSTVAEQVYQALEDDFVVIGDLIHCEVLQGVKTAKMRSHIDELFSGLNQMPLAGFAIAQRAAKHHRDLRERYHRQKNHRLHYRHLFT